MNLVPFNYGDVRIMESCMVADKPYFTKRSIGEWLGAKNPRRYINRLIERNPYINRFSTGVKLTAVEGGKKVTRSIIVYDPIGLQLIVMESHLPKAIEYKIAVARLVHDLMTGKFLENLVVGYLAGNIKLT